MPQGQASFAAGIAGQIEGAFQTDRRGVGEQPLVVPGVVAGRGETIGALLFDLDFVTEYAGHGIFQIERLAVGVADLVAIHP